MTVPKINSAHGSDTRNIINRAIEVLNRLGIDVQTLVAEGQLTPEQYTRLITIINSLVKSGDIEKSDLSPQLRSELANLSVDLGMKVGGGKLATLEDFDEDVLNFINDGSGGPISINAVPKDQSVTRGKIVSGAISADKTDFITTSSNLADDSELATGKTFSGSTGELVDGTQLNVSTINYIPVYPSTDYTSNYFSHLFYYDENKDFISFEVVGGGVNNWTTPSNAHYIRFTSSSHRWGVETQLNLGEELQEYEPFYLKLNDSVKTQQSANDLLSADFIKGSVSKVQYDGDGDVSSITHSDRVNGEIVREDSFEFSSSEIVETRSLQDGTTLIIKTNLSTLETEVI